jgi:putative DNA primase/helicase
MGDYCVTIPADTLAIERFNNSNAPEPQKVRLMGARTAICNEWDKNKTLDTTTLKRLASTGKISARTLNKEPVEWTPTHTLFIQSNDQPKVILENEGERRRVRIIPWTYTIPQEKRDSTMTDKLFREEASGILRWIVQGAVRYLALRERGEEIPTPEKATLATTSFIDKCDPFKGFIEECCDQAGNLEDSSNGLYEYFEGFCDENGLAKLNRRAFKARMLTIGIESHRTNAGVMYRGIARKQ